MSGDVQPRRRKDKRRKKEEEDVGTPPPTLVNPSPDPLAENLTIHVHKEGGTGGHWCARIIFFALLAILVGLIGVILIEHRGAADVDTPIAESRWATVFDGWVDDVRSSHDQSKSIAEDNHEHEQEGEEEEEGEDEGLNEEGSEEADQEDHEHAAEDSAEDDAARESEAEEEEEEEGQEDEDQGLDSRQEGGESEEEERVSLKQENEDRSEEKEQEEIGKELERDYNDESTEQLGNEDEEDDVDNDTNDEYEEEDENAALEEIDENTSGEENNAVEKGEDKLIDESDNEIDASIEGVDILRKRANYEETDNENLSTEFLGIPGVNEIDDNSAEPLEEVEYEEQEEVINESEIEPVVEEVEEEPSSAENNVSEDSTDDRELLDFSRRNTIIPPPRVDRIIPNIGTEIDKEYGAIETANYENLRSKYKKLETEVGEEELIRVRNQARDLHAVKVKKGGKKEKDADEAEEEEEEEVETSEEERISGSEEEELDEEEVEDEEEDYEEEVIDDSELVAKLEAKYGKLPTPTESEEEEEEEDEEEEDDDEEEDNDEDIRGWKRLKAPHGTQYESDDEPKSAPSRAKPAPKQGGAREYEYDDITSPDDAVIKEELDAAQGQTAEKRLSYYTDLLARRDASPRTRYEIARALDDLAEEKKDNLYLRRAIAAYQSVLELGTLVPPKLFRIAGERCINRLRFGGQYSGAEAIHKKLIARFSDEPRLRNQFAVTFLMQNKLSEARKVLQETLGRWPNDGFALVHYGFILKTGDGNMADGVMYLKAGIDTGEEGTIDGRFYFHLGDALVRLGRAEEADQVYASGAKNGLFPSVQQRSLYNVDRLTARPWWTFEQTSYKQFLLHLESNWQVIKAEGLGALNKNGYFRNEAENLRDKGKWQQYELFARGRKIAEHCSKTPRTCSLVEGFPPAAGCRRGQIKFSVMYPGTHVWPHCGPTNCRLRAHLGLSGTEGTYIRVGNETRTWREGSVIVFDDSFEHEVWHNGTLTRLVLIVDVWHPELNESERRTLPAI